MTDEMLNSCGEVDLSGFETRLRQEEKSAITIKKYMRDLKRFVAFAGGRELNKELLLSWKEQLVQHGYAVRSVNSMLASVNAYYKYAGLVAHQVRCLRLQRQIFAPKDRELTRSDYDRLLDAAKRQPRLRLVLQTICSTGIRVSELQYFTVEAVRSGEVVVSCKNKNRVILLPGKLKKQLLAYCGARRITDGIIFRTRSGKPLDRSNIWTQMKKLCQKAGVAAGKVFPHNLRRLFARCFYKVEHDIVKLADVLGHSSINTTRIYLIATAVEHQKLLDRMCLLRE